MHFQTLGTYLTESCDHHLGTFMLHDLYNALAGQDYASIEKQVPGTNVQALASIPPPPPPPPSPSPVTYISVANKYT